MKKGRENMVFFYSITDYPKLSQIKRKIRNLKKTLHQKGDFV